MNAQPIIYFYESTEPAFSRAYENSVGYDLYSPKKHLIRSCERLNIQTELKIQMPQEIAAKIVGRSGLSFKHGIEVGAGLIDPSYRGYIHVILYNHSKTNFLIQKGDRIAQLVFFRYVEPIFVKITDPKEFDPTNRDTKGFGSSGK